MNTVCAAEKGTPVAQRVRGQLGPVVHAHERRGETALGDERLELADDLIGADRARACITSAWRVCLSMMLTRPDRPPVSLLVGLEVQRPDLIGRSSDDLTAIGPVTDRALATTRLRDAQALLAPQALHALAVDRPAPPSVTRWWCARREPQRLRWPAKSRNAARNTRSSAAMTGSRRCVEWC
jgi:hypothetical protein